MPDKQGFDHYPDREFERVRCIVCSVEGPIWEWPEERRLAHADEHRAHPEPEPELVIMERRRAWRESKRRYRARRARTFGKRLCANPDCTSPFTPNREGQRYCRARCRDRSKYLKSWEAA